MNNEIETSIPTEERIYEIAKEVVEENLAALEELA